VLKANVQCTISSFGNKILRKLLNTDFITTYVYKLVSMRLSWLLFLRKQNARLEFTRTFVTLVKPTSELAIKR